MKISYKRGEYKQGPESIDNGRNASEQFSHVFEKGGKDSFSEVFTSKDGDGEGKRHTDEEGKK